MPSLLPPLLPVDNKIALQALQRFLSRHVSNGSSAAQNNDQRASLPSEAYAQIETVYTALATELGIVTSTKKSRKDKKRALEASREIVNDMASEKMDVIMTTKTREGEEDEEVTRKSKKIKTGIKSKTRSTGSSLLVTLMALLLIGLPNRVSGDCLMYQECTNPLPQPNMPACRPRQLPAPIKPFSLTGYPVRACPQYDIGCCTLDQNLLLYASLMQEKPLFGNLAAGGCPACYQNMQNFWCAYTCGPNQSDYLTILGAANVTSPENGETYEVLRTRVSVNKAFACDTYSSCESVKSVTQTSAMSNAEGFFNYQGEYEAIQHGAFIEFDLNSESSTALNPRTYSCCNFPVDFTNASLGNMSCPCAYCKGMCPGNACAGSSTSASTLGQGNFQWYTGINLITICASWGGVILAVLFCEIMRRYVFTSSTGTLGDSIVDMKSLPSFQKSTRMLVQ
jgi:hypothetical protein